MGTFELSPLLRGVHNEELDWIHNIMFEEYIQSIYMSTVFNFINFNLYEFSYLVEHFFLLQLLFLRELFWFLLNRVEEFFVALYPNTMGFLELHRILKDLHEIVFWFLSSTVSWGNHIRVWSSHMLFSFGKFARSGTLWSIFPIYRIFVVSMTAPSLSIKLLFISRSLVSLLIFFLSRQSLF